MKDMGKKRKKKPEKGLEKRIKQEEESKDEYNDEEEGMDIDKEDNVKEEGPSKAQESRKVESSVKRKREGEKEAERACRKGKERIFEALEERKEEQGLVKTTVSLDKKGKKNCMEEFLCQYNENGACQRTYQPRGARGKGWKNLVGRVY